MVGKIRMGGETLATPKYVTRLVRQGEICFFFLLMPVSHPRDIERLIHCVWAHLMCESVCAYQGTHILRSTAENVLVTV